MTCFWQPVSIKNDVEAMLACLRLLIQVSSTHMFKEILIKMTPLKFTLWLNQNSRTGFIYIHIYIMLANFCIPCLLLQQRKLWQLKCQRKTMLKDLSIHHSLTLERYRQILQLK